MINHEPEYLIVLYLRKNSDVFEVHNGPGREPWNRAGKIDSHNNRHMRVNKLMELDDEVADEDRILQLHKLQKMKAEFKNRK